MNKYEKLIEHIINDDEQAARKLFHQIVVEKSRDIYESLMDEELGGNPAENMVDEITNEVETDEEGLAEDDLETELDDAGIDDADDTEIDFDMDNADHGDLPADDMGGEEDIEDRVMDLESELEQLKAEFDKLMGTEREEHGDEEFDSEEDFDSEDLDSEEDSEDSEEMDLDEAKEEDEEDEEEDEEMQESRGPRSQADVMREYVEKVKDFYKGEASEGETVGTGKDKVAVNKGSVVAGKNDMGGSTANIVKGGSEQNPDGKQFKAPSNEYSKKSGELPHAGKFQNVPGAKAKQETTGKSYEKAHGKEGQTTGGSVPVNTKSEIGGKVR